MYLHYTISSTICDTCTPNSSNLKTKRQRFPKGTKNCCDSSFVPFKVEEFSVKYDKAEWEFIKR